VFGFRSGCEQREREMLKGWQILYLSNTHMHNFIHEKKTSKRKLGYNSILILPGKIIIPGR